VSQFAHRQQRAAQTFVVTKKVTSISNAASYHQINFQGLQQKHITAMLMFVLSISMLNSKKKRKTILSTPLLFWTEKNRTIAI
jgi:hypothetical protein